MSTMVAELYDALRKAGIDEQLAKDAACAVLAADDRIDLATRADLLALKDVVASKTELAELKVELIKWNVGAMAVLTGVFAAIVRLS